MKRFLLKYLILFLIFLSISAKAEGLDKAYYNNQTQNNDTARVRELIDLANECRYYFPESQAGYTREALEISKKTKYSLGEGLALKGLGNYFFEQGNYDSSFYYYTEAKSIFQKLGNNKELTNLIGDYCFLCINKGEYIKALEAGLTAFQIAEEMQDEEMLEYTSAYLGYTYYSMKNNEEAFAYLKAGLKLAKKRNDTNRIARFLYYLALVEEDNGNIEKAIQNYKFAAELLGSNDDKRLRGIAAFTIAEAYRCEKMHDKAIQEYLNSYQIVNQFYDQDGKNLITLRIARVYLDMLRSGFDVTSINGMIQNASFLSIDDMLLSTCNRLSKSGNKDNLLECLQLQVNLKTEKKQYKEAFELNNQLIALKDKLSELNKANILADLLVKYELEKDYEQIELLNLINKTNEDKINNQKTQFIFFAIVVFMLIAVLFALRHRIKTIARTKNEIDLFNSKLEAEKLRAEQSEQFKEQFLANVSHEIRTPLNAIIGITHILIKNEHLKLQETYLEAMRISSKNLLELINDILNLSKFEAGKVAIEKNPFRLKNILENVVNEIQKRATQKGNQLILKIDENVPDMVVGDDSMLHHILLTLVRNGNSFTENGEISLTCKLNYLHDEQALIGFTIQDTGIGIIKEKQLQLLNTFVKVHGAPALDYDGSGLELTIIKHMVELQEGAIELESEPGKGTIFRVEIPYLINISDSIEENNSKQTPKREETQVKNISILLVEDNDFNIMVARDELHSIIEGLNLDIAKNGKIALEKLQTEKFDLILMDLQMPEMNGFDATKTIRKLKGKIADVPIIAMTANTLESEIEKCLESGMNDFISKPFDTKILLEKISKLIRPKTTTIP